MLHFSTNLLLSEIKEELTSTEHLLTVSKLLYSEVTLKSVSTVAGCQPPSYEGEVSLSKTLTSY